MSTLLVAERAVRRTARAAARRLDVLAGPNGLDPFLRHVDPTWSTRTTRGRIESVRHPSADSVALTIRPNGGWTGFRAGQHVQVAVEVDGVTHHRCFSPTTSAHRDDTFDLVVKVHPTSVVGRHLKDVARRGDRVGLSAPDGTFVLPAPADRPSRLLFVSGGSGFTPVLSMLRTLADERHAGAVTWLHYDRTPADVAHDAHVTLLRALLPGLRVVTAFTRSPGAGDLDGHLDDTHLDQVEPDWRDLPVWACGPPPLLDALRDRYDADALHTEAFTLDLAPVDPATTGGTVTLRRSGRTVTDDGRPLLVQAEDAGLTPAHGCRRGICRTCTTPLVAGTVRDVTTDATTTVAAGDPCGTGVRLCVSAPVGDVELDL